VLSILVLEDLTMAVYLPLVAVPSRRREPSENGPVCLIGTGYSPSGSRSGCLLRRAAEPRWSLISQMRSYSSPFLARSFLWPGLRSVCKCRQLSGRFSWVSPSPDQWLKQTHRLLAPLRDLFAATFFFLFWASNRPGNPTVRVAPCRFAGCYNRRD